jgi:peptide deformylase
MVNPDVLEAGDAQRDFDGCLSFPGLYGDTVRPHFLRVAGQGERGESFERAFKGFDAVVVHHEIDHLDGILFIDRMEKLEDLYTFVEDDRGEPVRRAASEVLPSLLPAGLGA